jgi:hypothetical protein
MSLEKAIKHGKEKRKQYRGSKAFDHSCRNHGSCSWCEGNRKHSSIKRLESNKSKLKDFLNDEI